MKEVIMYQCGFCKKKYSYKGSAIRHEKECFHNPIHKACASCGNFYQEEKTIERDNEYPLSIKVPACSAGKEIGKVVYDDLGLPHSIASMKHGCKGWIPISEDEE
jgi:hypothetical protein